MQESSKKEQKGLPEQMGSMTLKSKIWHFVLFFVFLPWKSFELLSKFVDSKIKTDQWSSFYKTIAKVFLFLPLLLLWPNKFAEEYAWPKWATYTANIAIWVLIAIFLPPLFGSVTLSIANSAGFFSLLEPLGVGVTQMFNMFLVAGYTLLYNLAQWIEVQWQMGLPAVNEPASKLASETPISFSTSGNVYGRAHMAHSKQIEKTIKNTEDLLDAYDQAINENDFINKLGSLISSQNACGGLDHEDANIHKIFKNALNKKHHNVIRQILNACANGNDADTTSNVEEEDLKNILQIRNSKNLTLKEIFEDNHYRLLLGQCGITPNEGEPTLSHSTQPIPSSSCIIL